MHRYRVWLIISFLIIGVLLLGIPAAAWEFSMSGALSWELEGRAQGGSDGFFGKYDSAAVPGAGAAVNVDGAYAPYNAWLGDNGGNIVSGSDGVWNTQYMVTDMQLAINKAIRIRGQYYIGEWGPGGTGNLVASEYLNYRYGGIQQSFSPGYWNTLWLSAQLPWGSLTIGKRPSVWGTGLGWNGTESRSTESLSITAPYGPLRVGLSLYPSRKASTADYFNSDYDKNNTRIWDATAPNITYRSGPYDLGVIINIGSNSHRGGERVIAAPADRVTGNYRDRSDFYGGAYFKYYNGLVFFNAETDFYQRTDRNRQKLADGSPQAGIRDTYIEHWRWMVEVHALVGPAKASVLYAWSAGDDRRGNQVLNVNGAPNQATGNVTFIDRRGALYSSSFSNTGLFRPYSYLMVYGYGLGIFINPDTGNGYAEDASLWAGRVDYPVAANLNLYASLMYSNRVSSSGFAWGCISPDAAATDGSILRRVGQSGGTYVADRVGAPNIPDTGLGYEFDAGFTWRLLEGLTLNTTFAYWQPGDWFKWACVDKNVPNWGTAGVLGSTNPLDWGVNPDRGISPIYGMEIVLKGEF